MSAGNGTEKWADNAAAARLGITMRERPSFADMSSQQRSQSLDNMAAQIAALTAQVQALTKDANALNYRLERTVQPTYNVSTDEFYSGPIRTLESRVDACSEANLVNAMFRGRRFWQRLRWLVTGR